jgi:small subunit ribosomal protein S14
MDLLKRRLFVKFELKRNLLRSILLNRHLKPIIRLYVLYKLTFLPTIVSITKQNNRCVVSGRSYNVLSSVRLSRFQLRDLANNGDIPGLRKYS